MTETALAAAAGAAFALLVQAAVADLRHRRIPNWVSLALAAAFVPAAWLAGLGWPAVLVQHLGAAVVVFAVGLLAFARGWLGGGDVKLLTAAALWYGARGLFPLLLFTALVGGGLALLMLALRAVPQLRNRMPGLHGDRMPYGLAIGLGAVLAARHLDTLPPAWTAALP